MSRVREEENPPPKVGENETLIPTGLEGVRQVEDSHVSDLLRTQEGGRLARLRCDVLGGVPFGQWATGLRKAVEGGQGGC